MQSHCSKFSEKNNLLPSDVYQNSNETLRYFCFHNVVQVKTMCRSLSRLSHQTRLKLFAKEKKKTPASFDKYHMTKRKFSFA